MPVSLFNSVNGIASVNSPFSSVNEGASVVLNSSSLLGLNFAQGVYNLSTQKYPLSSFPNLSYSGNVATGSYASNADGSLVLFTQTSGVPRVTTNGVLIEAAATNLSAQSNFGGAANTPWTLLALSRGSYAGIDPAGTTLAAFITQDTSSAYHMWGYISGVGLATTASTDYVWSLYIKPVLISGTAGRYFWLSPAVQGAGSSPTGSLIFDLQAGVITQSVSSGSGVAPSVITLPNGWYRLICPITTGAGSSATDFRGGYTNSPTAINSYVGDGSSTVAVFGNQIETGKIATSLIATTTSSVTRSIDNLVITGLSSLINSPPYTFAANSTLFANGNFPSAAALSDGSAANQFGINHVNTSSDWRPTGRVASAVYPADVTLTGSGAAFGVPQWAAIQVGSNSATFAAGGTSYPAWTASGTPPLNLTTLTIGDAPASVVNPLNGYVKNIQVVRGLNALAISSYPA
jgi:hypothetical protein